MLARWIFTVPSLMPSVRAIILFVLPMWTKRMICACRGDSSPLGGRRGNVPASVWKWVSLRVPAGEGSRLSAMGGM